jgi:hypothetical protein
MVEVFIAFLLLLALILLTLPPMQEWHFASCNESGSIACNSGRFVLMYWWLGALPLHVLIAFGLHKSYSAFRGR